MGYYFFYKKNPNTFPNYTGYIGRIKYDNGLLNNIDTSFSKTIENNSEKEVKYYGRKFISDVIKHTSSK